MVARTGEKRSAYRSKWVDNIKMDVTGYSDVG
jgi:hypothetical protein